MPSRTSAKSAKAIKAAGKSSPSLRKGGGGGKLPTKRNVPWMLIGAIVTIVALVGAIAWYLVPKYHAKEELKNPSAYIDGVVKKEYDAGLHVASTQRVAYDQTPAFGGPHDSSWAACTGVVYSKAIRTENAVHSLEHGAVWITYNPDKVDAAGIDTLKKKVEGQPYMLMSPYPNLDKPISLQAWGHQLKLDSVSDARVDRFIKDLRLNPNTYPEVGASCANPTFDPNNPPAFDPSAPGPDAVPMDGNGLTPDPTELGGTGGLMPGGLPGGDLGGLGGLDGSTLPTDLFPTVPVPADGQTENPGPATDAPAAGQ
ncbi:DUF3105 domain-containing protein [Nocardia sp. 2]|uniref:DUF3105 domain-containing protein n=1 Tax=Nocardia acididurans TaxID=2802282 RepID=A0ABS1M4C1_9NOCA|nr:DUF3105 domain-containing protein [Nocardia acididurans]MBL1074895.1 DUF3105 domain-containing protein [Nocardia acididurans]